MLTIKTLSFIDFFTPSQQSDYSALKSNEAKRLLLQILIKSNFPALVYLLNFRDLGEFHKEQLLELGRLSSLESQPKRKLWLWSRGHFKTSLISEAHSVYLILNNPNIRLLIVSNTLEIARKVLGNIKSQFIINNDFRYFFKEFCPVANKEGKIEFGTTEYFTVPNRTKSLKEPTVMCSGVGTNLTGLHFDYMKIDDLVTRESVSNDTQILASKDYYASLRQLFDNPTIPREDVIGTPYHFNDLYADLKKNEEFKFSFIPARINDEITFPERFSNEGLRSIENDPAVGPYNYSSQYLLNPINPADIKFKEEWLKFYDKLPDGLSEYLLCDPASTVKKKSDYTVILKLGIDSEGLVYLMDGVRDKLRADQRTEKYVIMAKSAKRLKGAKYEVLGGRHGDLETISLKFIAERISVTPCETKSTNASKIDRIEQRLVGQFHAGSILLPRQLIQKSEYDGKTYDFIQLFRLEYLQFPMCEHDDILDCFSQLFDGEYIAKGDKNSKPANNDDEFEWWRTRAIQFRNPRKSRYIFGMKNKSFGIPSTESFR